MRPCPRASQDINPKSLKLLQDVLLFILNYLEHQTDPVGVDTTTLTRVSIRRVPISRGPMS